MYSAALRSLALARRVRWGGGGVSKVSRQSLARPAVSATLSQYRWNSSGGGGGGGGQGHRGRQRQRRPQGGGARADPRHAQPVNAPPRHTTADGAISVGDATGFSMALQFLGTASTFPTSARSTSALTVSFRCGSVWLFDCGENTQLQLRRVSWCVVGWGR